MFTKTHPGRSARGVAGLSWTAL